jgi:hypothetical protein
MTVAMLVAGDDAGQPVVGPAAAGRLAVLGVTHVSLLSDHSGIGVVLEGWAFDPTRVDEAVRAVFPDSHGAVRVLREVEHVAVSSLEAEGSR